MIDTVDRVMAVMEAAFPREFGEAWTRGQLESALLVGNCHLILITADGRAPHDDEAIAGFSLSRSGVDEEELLLFAVAPEWRGRGLGSRMMDRLAAQARARGASRLLLEMRAGNAAESLYRQQGFHPIGRRPNYYKTTAGDRIDALTFARQL